MTGQQEAAAGTEQALPAIGDDSETDAVLEQAEGTQETEQEETNGQEAEGEQQGEDLDDLEFAFGKYKVPKKLAEDVRGLQKAFTEKTQTFSKQVRELQERATARAEANEAELTARAQLHHINQEAKRLEGFGWAEYQQARQADPIGADEAWNYKTYLSQQKAHLEGEIQTQQTNRSQEAQQEFAKRVEETRQFAMQQIEGWSPETDAKLLKFAQDMEIPEEFIRTNLSPVFYKILHRAWIGQQTIDRKPAAAKPTTQVQPTTRIASKATPGASKTLSEMDMEEYVAARRKQGV